MENKIFRKIGSGESSIYRAEEVLLENAVAQFIFHLFSKINACQWAG